MDVTHDELAGVVDLFGALTRAELAEALAELAFKRGEDPPDEDVVEGALAAYALVEHEPERDDEEETEPLLVAGPAAFPALPDGAQDLPHIMDVPERAVDRKRVASAVEERFRAEAARAAAGEDADRIDHLLDVSYDLETWGPVDLGEARDRLDAAAGRTS